MISFESDYTTGAHPDVLRALEKTNLEPLPGCGTDFCCERFGAFSGAAALFFMRGIR